jgi:hypothetical protein
LSKWTTGYSAYTFLTKNNDYLNLLIEEKWVPKKTLISISVDNLKIIGHENYNYYLKQHLKSE